MKRVLYIIYVTAIALAVTLFSAAFGQPSFLGINPTLSVKIASFGASEGVITLFYGSE